MTLRPARVVLPILFATAVAGATALAAEDRSSLRVPDGLSFANITAFERWEPVSVSQTETSLKIISANPTMMRAYRDGLPAAGKTFPDGSTAVKIEWARKPLPDLPPAGFVPGELKSIQFMEKDSKRYASSGGWAYAKFNADPTTGELKPQGKGVDCGHACHSIVAAKDYVFTRYPPR